MPVLFDNPLHALVHVEGTADWLIVSEICKEYLTGKDYIQLQEYLKDDAKTLLVEKTYIDKDYRDTFSNFYSKKFACYPSTTFRLHFFNKLIQIDDLFSLDKHDKSYIGFTVIRPTQINSIGRTILDPNKLSKISGIMCTTKYCVHILGAELEIKGFPYISQDTDVTICAHAATWMTFRYFSERYSTYREILPYEISQLSGNVAYGRLVPSKGITVSQVAEIFSNYGFYPEIYLREQYKDSNFFYRLLYYYLESGIPLVACLRQDIHAITVIGHISDYSRKPDNKNSEDFLTGYIVNDDNCPPYQLVLRKGVPQNGHCSKYNIENIDGFIVPLYEKMYLSAEYIEQLASSILDHPAFGVDVQSKLIKHKNLIKRIYLTSSRSYKKARRKKKLPFDLQKNYCEMPMPKFIWVCELSLEGFYPKKQIVGEILFDATANHRDRFAFLAIHYPDFILFNDRNKLGNAADRFKPFRLPVEKIIPYAMYENNLKEIKHGVH